MTGRKQNNGGGPVPRPMSKAVFVELEAGVREGGAILRGMDREQQIQGLRALAPLGPVDTARIDD